MCSVVWELFSGPAVVYSVVQTTASMVSGLGLGTGGPYPFGVPVQTTPWKSEIFQYFEIEKAITLDYG